jgi:zinc protease
LFRLFILHRPDVPPERIEQIVYEEIARLSEEGIADEELERIRTQLVAQRWSDHLYYGLQSPLGRALGLAFAAVFDGDPNSVNRELERLLRIESRDVQQAAQYYLNSSRNRTVMTIVPGAQGGAA